MEKIRNVVVQIVTLSTILAILATVIHELSFYWWLAPELVDLPQASDYLITAMRWLPAAGLIMLGGLVGIFVPRADGHFFFTRSVWKAALDNDGNDLKQLSGPRRLFGVFSSVVLFGLNSFIFFVAVTMFLFVANPPALAAAIVFGLVWFLACKWFIFRVIDQWISQEIPALSAKIGLMFTPLIIGLIAVFGILDAQKIQNAEKGTYSINLEDIGVIEDVLVVRNLAAGVIIAIPHERRIQFYPWSDIKSVATEVPPKKRESRFCGWLGSPPVDGDQEKEWFLTMRLQKVCQAFAKETNDQNHNQRTGGGN